MEGIGFKRITKGAVIGTALGALATVPHYAKKKGNLEEGPKTTYDNDTTVFRGAGIGTALGGIAGLASIAFAGTQKQKRSGKSGQKARVEQALPQHCRPAKRSQQTED